MVQESLDIDQSQGEDTCTHSCERGAAATPDFAIVRTLHSSEMIKHDQTYTTEVSVSDLGFFKHPPPPPRFPTGI